MDKQDSREILNYIAELSRENRQLKQEIEALKKSKSENATVLKFIPGGKQERGPFHVPDENNRPPQRPRKVLKTKKQAT